MAGDWIKIEHALSDKPEVRRMADMLSRNSRDIVGTLVRFWSWVDQNLSEECPSVYGTEASIDDIVGCPGFASAMVKCGWLTIENSVVSIPNYDSHLSESAKARAVESKRKRLQRRKKRVPDLSHECPKNSGQKAGPEKRREEKIDTTTSSISGRRPKFTKPTFEEVQAYCQERGNKIDPQRFLDHYESNGWRVGKTAMKDWRAAIRTWEKNQNGNAQGNHSAGHQPTASREQERIDRNLQTLAEFAAGDDETRIFEGNGGPRRIEADG